MYKYFQRLCDLLLSGLLLALLSPLLIPVIIGLLLTGEGYVFYRQERVGFKNKHFHILKFATMLKDSPNMAGGIITSKKDPRITPMGGFLRRSKINEIPQLFNIFLGDMSFVGPRPVMPKSFHTYPENVQKVIYNVKPGLTGIGSVVFRDEEQLLQKVKEEGQDSWKFYSEEIYPFKGQLELWYQKNKSFSTDYKLLLLTTLAVLKGNSLDISKYFKNLPQRPF